MRMQLMSFAFLRRAGIVLACALLPALAVPGIAAPADARFDALLAQALDLQAQAPVAASEAELEFYVGNDSEMILLEIGVWIEGVPGVRRHTYSDLEARALLRGGLQRAFPTEVAPAPRRLRVDFLARPRDAARTDAPVRGQLEQRIEGSGPFALKLEGGGLAGFGAPRLRLSPVGDVAQARARHADFLQASGRAVAAAFERRAAGVAATVDPALPAEMPAAAGTERYNAALDALAAGQLDGARTALTELGIAEARTRQAWSLRDRANLQLGYLELRAGRPAEAALAFERVRSPGPESNAALLGLGWARLIPASAAHAADMFGAQVALRSDDANLLAATRRRTPFRYAGAVAEGSRAQDLRRALVPWSELIGRDPTDVAVQEGLLAVAYAHDHLGAHEQAQRYYQRALDTFGHLLRHYDAALRDVESGGLAPLWTATANADGWPAWFAALPEPRWWLSDPPNAPVHFYFERLVGESAFRGRLDALTGYGELGAQLQLQAQALSAQPAALARNAELQAQVRQARAQLQAELVEIARASLQQRRREVERPIAEAAFALARMRDDIERADAGVLP